MGYNVYVSKPLMPAVKMLQDAYLAWGLDAEELNDVLKQEIDRRRDGNQVTTKDGDHHKEENERKERTKENKEKEENPSSSSEKRNLKKKFCSNTLPLLEDVEVYHKELGITEFTAAEFFDYYETYGWLSKSGSKILDWKCKMRSWKRNYNRYTNRKSTNNVTNKNQQRQAAGAGAQAGQAGDAEEHRQEDMERHLENHHPGDDRLARLAREINQVAQEMGVPTTEYSLRQIAYDAQSLLYRMAFCEGWTDEKWKAAMAHVKAHIKGKKLNTDVLIGEVFEWSKGFKL